MLRSARAHPAQPSHPCGQYISNKTFCESNEADAGVLSLGPRKISPRAEILPCAQDETTSWSLILNLFSLFGVRGSFMGDNQQHPSIPVQPSCKPSQDVY